MENELIDNKFDDIDEKVDFLIELCKTLKSENESLMTKVKNLELEVETKGETEEQYARQQAVIRSKIDGLLSKLNNFSDAP